MRLFPSSSSPSSTCAILAAALSESYRSYEPYNPNNPNNIGLEHFLDTNGILLTMCMEYNGLVPWLECPTHAQQRVASSWIQQNLTGFRVVSPPIDVGYPVGLVLQPSKTQIRCVYPADAATIQRDNDGCGVLSYDPKYGSKGYDKLPWYRKMILKEEIIKIKNDQFGPNRTWDSIPCNEFNPYNGTPMDQVAIYGEITKEEEVEDDGTDSDEVQGATATSSSSSSSSSWSYQSQQQYVLEQWSYIMGHEICNASKPLPPPSFDSRANLIYTGLEYWESNQWNEMIDLMELTLHNHSHVGTWNELVLNVTTTDFEEAVQAVFYVKTGNIKDDWISRRIAIREGKKLGNKPIMYVDQKLLNSYLSSSSTTTTKKKKKNDDDDDIDLFHCDSDYQSSYLRAAKN